MSLFLYLGPFLKTNTNPPFPINVIGNGYGTSAVPIGQKGKVLTQNGADYLIIGTCL